MNNVRFPIKKKYSLKDKIEITTTALKEQMSLRNASEVAYLTEQYGEGILDSCKDNINLNDVFRYYAPSLDFIEKNKCMENESCRNTLLRNSYKRDFDDFLNLFNKYQSLFKEQEVKNIIYAMSDYSKQGNEDRQNAEDFIENFQPEINKYDCWNSVFYNVKNLSPEFIINHKDNIRDDFKKYIEDNYGCMTYLEDMAQRGDGTSIYYKDGQLKVKQLDDNLKLGDKVCCLKHSKMPHRHEVTPYLATIKDIKIDENCNQYYYAEFHDFDFQMDHEFIYEFNFTKKDFYKEVFPTLEHYEQYLDSLNKGMPEEIKANQDINDSNCENPQYDDIEEHNEDDGPSL